MVQTRLVMILAWLVVVLLIMAARLMGHNTQILNCSEYKTAVKLDEEVLTNGMLVERYDTDGDGQANVAALSVTTGLGEHQAFPTLYVIDEDADGQADVVMVDKLGDGDCNSIVLYLDLHKEQAGRQSGKVGL